MKKIKIPKNNDRRLLYLSTRHMTPDDDSDLADSGLMCDVLDGGWLVVVMDEHELNERIVVERGVDIDRFTELTISGTLHETLLLARKLGFDYLRFDCDAPTIPGFPKGDWK